MQRRSCAGLDRYAIIPAVVVGHRLSRRELLRRGLGTGAVLAGGSLIAACATPGRQNGAPLSGANLPPPETGTVRIVNPAACDPPLALAREFLLEEGFTDVQYVKVQQTTTEWLTTGVADFNVGYGNLIAANVDAGLPLVTLSGLHPGCFELWARPGIESIRDLRGKTIAVNAVNVSDQFFGFFSTLLAFVGIPHTDVNFIEVKPAIDALRDAFLDGRSQAFVAPAAFGPELRRNPRNPGKLILDTTVDKPWSQYYCCQLVANREWARQHPIATKRVTRAVARAADAVQKDRTQVGREYVARGFHKDEGIVNETIAMLSYDWREIDPEDTLRFFALRLGDAKLIKSTPQQIIAQGSDFAFMRQLRTELKL